MTEYVAIPKNLLDIIMSESRAYAHAIDLRRDIDRFERSVDNRQEQIDAEAVPISGAVCPECAQMYCSEYSEGSRCSTPFCDGNLIEIGERIDQRDNDA